MLLDDGYHPPSTPVAPQNSLDLAVEETVREADHKTLGGKKCPNSDNMGSWLVISALQWTSFCVDHLVKLVLAIHLIRKKHSTIFCYWYYQLNQNPGHEVFGSVMGLVMGSVSSSLHVMKCPAQLSEILNR